ncbi:hypothetical protein GH714_024799 [Hevea brasiliensis]|uniref:DUF4219 domain-containing protein n=1 Tax=Hevea brasiliensis TaxID=3981 RepID=A0A6A6NIV5_HEVBR|nr:hypothetical protein GH714_024799 [Hevea brasiliensis]
MDGENSFSTIAPPVFDGENYQVWAVRMEAYMDACDLWEAVEEDYEIPPLLGNPTLAQIKNHKEKKTRNSKAKASLYDVEEYQGDERIRGMKVLNLVREFEIQRMKESETIKEYSDRLISLANKGYSDSDWAGSADDMKSTSGYCFNFGSGCFSWCSKKQDIVAQSTAEAEFIVLLQQRTRPCG